MSNAGARTAHSNTAIVPSATLSVALTGGVRQAASALDSGRIGSVSGTLTASMRPLLAATAGTPHLALALDALDLRGLRVQYGESNALSLVGVGCLAYFFAPPIYSFRIDSPEDIITVAGFLITSLIVTGLLRRTQATKGELANLLEERKRALEALRESEEQWRAVFENNPTMYFMVDASGTILSVNPFGAEKLGYTVEELVGSPVLNVFCEADREAVQRNVAVCLEQLGRAMSWELRKVRKDSTVLWVRETAKAVVLKNRPSGAFSKIEPPTSTTRLTRAASARHCVVGPGTASAQSKASASSLRWQKYGPRNSSGSATTSAPARAASATPCRARSRFSAGAPSQRI